MAYTAINDPEAYFQAVLYTGNGSTQSVTLPGDTDMQPDLVWIKRRDGVHNYRILDAVRGALKMLQSNGTEEEIEPASDTLTAFGSDGFTLGADAGDYGVNTNTQTMVAWCWKAGTSFSNDASATSIGSLDSTGSVSADSGFSIVSWTGDGNAATIKHGLSTKPDVIILKNRSITEDWPVYHHKISSASDKYVHLNNNNAIADYPVWNDTAPTTSVFSVGGYAGTNGDGNSLIVYCFTGKQGFSKFGSYVGNGNADGTFVYLGFRPAYVLFKGAASNREWIVADNKRDTYNLVDEVLYTNTNDAAGTYAMVDFLSNGFKFRHAAGPGTINTSDESYIFMAFAEAPFVNSNGVPCNAR